MAWLIDSFGISGIELAKGGVPLSNQLPRLS